jgi:hypothetical protein
MNSTAAAIQEQAGSWPELEPGPLIAGGLLLGIGGMLALIGLAVAGSHVAAATRRWVHAMDVPPAELARLKWDQARTAAAAGASSWREHPNAKIGWSGRTTSSDS